jgi:hypothetical protein
MGLLVRARGKAVWVNDPMGAVEKLSSFENHLYDMLVAMMSRCDASIEVKEEDVHLGTFHFLAPLRSVLVSSAGMRIGVRTPIHTDPSESTAS